MPDLVFSTIIDVLKQRDDHIWSRSSKLNQSMNERTNGQTKEQANEITKLQIRTQRSGCMSANCAVYKLVNL